MPKDYRDLGAHHLDRTEHHVGMVTAIAFEVSSRAAHARGRRKLYLCVVVHNYAFGPVFGDFAAAPVPGHGGRERG